MASLVKLGFKNFLTRQVARILPLQVVASQQSSSTSFWQPPGKVHIPGGVNRRWTNAKAVAKKFGYPKDKFFGQAAQEWWDWNGFGPYKYRHHNYPNNLTLRDVQKRRIFKLFAEERLRVNSIFKNEILPKELRDVAYEEIHDIPRSSAITRINRRCAVTGRGRGVFHQYRVSRFIFRHEADYNKLSGVMRAIWIKTVHVDP